MALKQCPFCASERVRIESWPVTSTSFEHTEYAMMCLNCGAFGPNDLGRSGAIESWNLRREKFPGYEKLDAELSKMTDGDELPF